MIMQKCKCGSSDRMTKGLCYKCYAKSYRENPLNKERIHASKIKWRLKNRDSNYRYLERDQIHYGGNREIALKRDDYQCTICGDKSKLTVHHKDNKGRGTENPNNSLSNLITLCRKCHMNIHRSDVALVKKYRKNGFWSKTHKQCIECGTTKTKHNSHGLCSNCYARTSRKHKI